jgi:hypothetical protein
VRPRTPLLLALSLGIFACKEPPSYRARWGIFAEAPLGCVAGGDAELTSSCECSERGLGDMRLVTRDAAGVPVDVRTRPCFPPAFADLDGTVAGPTLPPGEYAIEVRGIKRQRGAQDVREGPDLQHLDYTIVWGADQYSYQWVANDETEAPDDLLLDPIDAATPSCTAGMEDLACVAGAIACDCVSLVIEGDETVELDDFEISAPPECDNGVDDDQDGLVDGADPACTSTSGTEDAPIGGAQVRLDVAFFDGNPHLDCDALALLGAQGLRASLLDVPADTPDDIACDELPDDLGAPASTTDLACAIGSAFFSVTGTVGRKCLDIEVIDGSGQPRTIAERRDLVLAAGPASFFAYAVDFEAGDFSPPIEQRAQIAIAFDAGGDLPRICTDAPAITSVEIEVLDAHGGELPVPVVDAAGTPLDGTARPCSDMLLVTESLAWGGYTMRIAAYVGEMAETKCFEVAAVPLAPASFGVVVPPVGGALPVGCE